MTLLAAAAQATSTTTTTAVSLAADPDAPAPYAIPTAAPYNSPESLTIPTYDGSGETVHPSVIDFGTPWNGWRYWMAMTPFPGSDDRYEDPSIVVSQNGYYWQVPDGLTNPLYPAPPEPGFNSDTHLIHDPVTDELVLTFRTTLDNSHHDFYVVRSSDGVTWPAERPTALVIPPGDETQLVSPSMVRLGATDWRIWALGRSSRRMFMWTATAAEGPYSGPYATVGPGTGGPRWNWHLDVQRFDGTYYATIDRGPLYLGNPDGTTPLTSLDGMHWRLASDILQTGPEGAWDSSELYRSSLATHPDDPTKFRLWYSSRGPGSPSVWGTGYTEVPTSLYPDPPPLPVEGSGTDYRDTALGHGSALMWTLGADPLTTTTEPDVSGNSRTGTYTGGYARASSLNGDSGYASALDVCRVERDYEAWMASESFTIRAIIRPFVLSGTIVSLRGADGGWFLSGGGYTKFEASDGTDITFSGLLSQNTTYHLAVVVNSGTVSAYRNGSLVGTGSGDPSSTVTSSAKLVLGARWTGAAYDQYGRGDFQSFDFVPSALSSAQILASAQAAGLA